MRREKKYVHVLRRVFFAGLMTVLLGLLGLFGGLGYHLYGLKEVSFTTHDRLGYADASFKINLTYNPVLYPAYWLIGRGSINGTYSILASPLSYSPGESVRPNWGLSRQDRADQYLINMLVWGMPLNLLALFSVAIAIEIVRERGLYFVLFGGLLGFNIQEMQGVIVGGVAGALVALTLLKLRPNNPIVTYWRSLWSETIPNSQNSTRSLRK
jgi:hypothetical protein